MEVGQHLGNLMKDLKAAIQEKESQCQTFRELLLEKESEVQELSRMVEERDGSENVNDDMKNKLMEVLSAAGNSVNGDAGYDQLLSMVSQLIVCGEKEFVEKDDIGTSEKDIKKLGDENEVLSRECKLLNDKLTQSEKKIIQFEAQNSQCLESEAVNNLKQEIETVRQSNHDLTENNESQKALIKALKASKDESQEILKENYDFKISLSNISDEKNSLMEQLEEKCNLLVEKEKLLGELQVVVSQLEEERDLKDQEFVNKLSSEVEVSKSLEVQNNEIKLNLESSKDALNTAKMEIQKLSEINSDLLQSVSEKTYKIINLEETCKNLREEGNEESTVINQLQGELDVSRGKITELSEELQICKKDKEAIIVESRNQETKFVEERINFQKQIEVKEASFNKLNENKLLMQKEMDANKEINASLVE